VVLTRAQMKQLQDEHVAAETRKDLAGAVVGYLEDCYYQNVPLGFRIQGRERVAAYYQRTWEALPDGEVTVEGEAFGDDVAVHWGTFRSTFRGKLLGARATARRLEFPVIYVLTFRDGKIRSESLVFDLATMCEQIGVSLEEARRAITYHDLTDQVWQNTFVPRPAARR
jgi:carboxymethylenebutenolidase